MCRGSTDDAVLAELSRGLSSGDILNICLNAIYAASTNPNPVRWMLPLGINILFYALTR
jgi:hypothetical protein